MTQQLSALQKIQQAAVQAAEVAAVDMTETGTGGGSERRILETGSYMARFCEYIEKGTQKNEWEPSKPPRAVAELRFALFPVDTVDGVRTVSKDPVFLTTYDQTISNHEKATMKGIYNKMNYRNDASKTHVAMFLGEAFMIGAVKYKNKAEKDANKLDVKLLAPAIDPVSGAPYPVPELEDKYYRAFFWDNPTQETWDSLFIEGKRDDGTSMNFIQEGILKAVDFPGSALEQLLGGASDIPSAMYQEGTESPAESTPEPAGASTEAPVASLPDSPVAPALPDAAPWEDPAEVEAPEVPDVPAVPVAPVLPGV